MKFHSLGNILGAISRYHALALLASLVLFSGPLRAASDDGELYAGTVGPCGLSWSWNAARIALTCAKTSC